MIDRIGPPHRDAEPFEPAREGIELAFGIVHERQRHRASGGFARFVP